MSDEMLKLADELHAFIAAVPHEYPGHNVELFERAEKALRAAASAEPAANAEIVAAQREKRQVYVAELNLDRRYVWCIVEAFPRIENVIEKFGSGPDGQAAADAALAKAKGGSGA